MEGKVTDDEEERELCQREDELCEEFTTKQSIFVYWSDQQTPECAIFFFLQDCPGRCIDISIISNLVGDRVGFIMLIYGNLQLSGVDMECIHNGLTNFTVVLVTHSYRNRNLARAVTKKIAKGKTYHYNQYKWHEE